MTIEKTATEPVTLDQFCGEAEGTFERFLEEKSRKLSELDSDAVENALQALHQETSWAA